MRLLNFRSSKSNSSISFLKLCVIVWSLDENGTAFSRCQCLDLFHSCFASFVVVVVVEVVIIVFDFCSFYVTILRASRCVRSDLM